MKGVRLMKSAFWIIITIIAILIDQVVKGIISRELVDS